MMIHSDFSNFMAEHDRGVVGRELVDNVKIGQRVFARVYGEGTITDIKGESIYIDFNNKIRIFKKQYLYNI